VQPAPVCQNLPLGRWILIPSFRPRSEGPPKSVIRASEPGFLRPLPCGSRVKPEMTFVPGHLRTRAMFFRGNDIVQGEGETGNRSRGWPGPCTGAAKTRDGRKRPKSGLVRPFLTCQRRVNPISKITSRVVPPEFLPDFPGKIPLGPPLKPLEPTLDGFRLDQSVIP